MKIIDDDLWLCVDCTMVAVNGDSTGIEDDEREAEVCAAVEAMGPHLVPNSDSETGEGQDEFSWRPCDCCGSSLGGARERFALLGEDE